MASAEFSVTGGGAAALEWACSTPFTDCMSPPSPNRDLGSQRVLRPGSVNYCYSRRASAAEGVRTSNTLSFIKLGLYPPWFLSVCAVFGSGLCSRQQWIHRLTQPDLFRPRRQYQCWLACWKSDPETQTSSPF